MKIGLISSAFPPDADGIGDYTWWLSRELARQGHQVNVFTSSRSGRVPPEGVVVVECGETEGSFSVARLISVLNEPQSLDWLLLQYNPFSYGRRGYCPGLVLGLRRLRSKLRLAVMFHETRVPRWPMKFALMRCWQTPQLYFITRFARITFISTERWRREVQPNSPAGARCEHSPVGSNLPLCSLTKAEARQRAGLPQDALVLGMFGSAHVSRLVDWAVAAARALGAGGSRAILLYVGPSAMLPTSDEQVSIINCGFLSAEEAALRIRTMDLLLAPFSDGMSTRRTSVMAALQHGVPVVTTTKPWTDVVFEAAPTNDFLMVDAQDAATFARETRTWWLQRSPRALPVEALTRFFEKHFAWPMIARAIVQNLERAAGPANGTPVK